MIQTICEWILISCLVITLIGLFVAIVWTVVEVVSMWRTR